VEQEHLFISDVHIGAFGEKQNEAIEKDLIRLIEYAIARKSKLYILGDLFDYWMEFPGSDFIPGIGKNVLKAFSKYNHEVGAAFFVTGNHDNWTLGYFERIGFEVESDFRILEIENKRVLLIHGDGLLNNSDRLDRPVLHRLLRNPFFLKIYRGVLPKKMAINLMKMFSNSTKKIDRRDPNPLNRNAREVLSRNIADVVLAGHDHIPRLETFNSGFYINLGTFFHHRTLVRGLDGVFSLVQWDAHNQQFKPYS